MSNEEAIKYIKQDLHGCYGTEKYFKAHQMAIEALKKQSPTKPNYQGDEKCMDAYCPNCGEWLDDGDVICYHCHQIIDWSNSND